MDAHDHIWQESKVEIGPVSTETWGPLMADMLDDPIVGDITKLSLDSTVATDAQAEEFMEEIGRFRVCEVCGRTEVYEDHAWVTVPKGHWRRR